MEGETTHALAATTRPGLDGTYRDTCVGCLHGTDSALCLEGEAEFLIATLRVIGVEPPTDAAMVTALAGAEYGCDPGTVPTGDMRMQLQLCAACAARGGLQVALIAGGELPLYRQPDDARYES